MTAEPLESGLRDQRGRSYVRLLEDACVPSRSTAADQANPVRTARHRAAKPVVERPPPVVIHRVRDGRQVSSPARSPALNDRNRQMAHPLVIRVLTHIPVQRVSMVYASISRSRGGTELELV